MPVKEDVIEVVEWLDHCSTKGGQWESFEDICEDLKPLTVHSVGWVIKETKESVTLIPTWHNEQAYGDILIIKRCIISRQKFKLRK